MVKNSGIAIIASKCIFSFKLINSKFIFYCIVTRLKMEFPSLLGISMLPIQEVLHYLPPQNQMLEHWKHIGIIKLLKATLNIPKKLCKPS